MRLLHIFPSFARGGQQMRLAALSEALGAEFQHEVVSLDGDLSAEAAFSPPIAARAFPARKGFGVSPRNMRDLAHIIEEAAPDILCTYNFGSIEAALANRLGPKTPHVHFEDGFGSDESLGRQKPHRAMLRRFALSRCTTVVPSRTLERIARRKWGLSRAKVVRIANGVDLRRFGVARAEQVPAFADESEAPNEIEAGLVVGSVGALRPEKNYARLVRAFAKADGGGARLLIVGEGPERATIEAAAGSLGGRLLLPGARDDPESAYAEFDVFALSSDTEQMPLSLMEAMAAALPVVATDVGDVADMVAEENRVFIVPPRDEAAFSAALRTLLGAPALRARLGAANARKARDEFALQTMVARYRTLFLETALKA